MRSERSGHRIRSEARQNQPLLDIVLVSIFLIAASCVADFCQRTPQIHFIDSHALRDSEEMSASTANPGRITKGRRTIS
jgi:hypothetical protein